MRTPRAESDSPLPPSLTSTAEVCAVLVMGVCGAGKTTVGELLARRLGWRFLDGDDLHPEANVRKMASGRPLDDADRAPWLDRVKEALDVAIERRDPAVLTCSALKESYRQRLGLPRPRAGLLHLTGPEEVLAERMAQRRGHFMPADLLRSQLDTLEPPEPPALVLDVRSSPAALASAAIRRFGLREE
ncbi:MAG: gluconokinase [Acidobacteriota bacterium]